MARAGSSTFARFRPAVAVLLLGLPLCSFGGGPLGVDNAVDAGDATGIFARRYQRALQIGAPLLVVGSALWEGADSRFGETAWQATDSLALGFIASESMKRVFSRSRPSQSDSPNEWFRGSGHRSFPSGEVMEITTAVTPFVLEYAPDCPPVWGLALLPAYDAVARVRNRAHWQTDVLASLAIGTGIGYYAHSRQTAISVQLLPRGITVGWKTRF
jgi:membrane-associated phospholipid phosphatase